MYEKASEYRDLIENINAFSQNKKTIIRALKNQDYISLIRKKNFAGVFLIKVRYGKLLSSDFFILNTLPEASDFKVCDQFIKQYYLSRNFLPETIHTSIGYESLEVLNVLKKRQKKIKFAQKHF